MVHTHGTKDASRSIKFSFVLNSLFTIAEFTFGIITGSLALVADAIHNLTDTFTLTISYFANRLADRDANDSKTYGYGRATILAAFLNCSILLASIIFIVIEAIQRLQNPLTIEGGTVAAVASVGIVVNGTIAYILSKYRQDLNMRSAFLDMAFDVISSIATALAGLLIILTGIRGIDSIVALAIAGLLLYNVYKILKEVVHILLEGTPSDVDIAAITHAIRVTDKVIAVDDMHVWAINSGYNALSCHIVIDETELKNSREIVEQVKATLRNSYNIQHATIEVELDDCTTHDDHERH